MTFFESLHVTLWVLYKSWKGFDPTEDDVLHFIHIKGYCHDPHCPYFEVSDNFTSHDGPIQ